MPVLVLVLEGSESEIVLGFSAINRLKLPVNMIKAAIIAAVPPAPTMTHIAVCKVNLFLVLYTVRII